MWNVRKQALIKEIKLAKITSKDNILFIGGGPFPSTPELLVQELNVHITCIEINDTILNAAKRYVEKKNIAEKITFLNGDGATFPIQNFDVIILAINISPIHKVLNHISLQMKKNARIIYRSMDKEHIPINDNTIKTLTVTSYIKNPLTTLLKYPMTYSILLEEK